VPVTTFDGPAVPLLLLHGDRDAFIPIADGAIPLFDAAPAPAWQVTLIDGTHTGFVDAVAESSRVHPRGHDRLRDGLGRDPYQLRARVHRLGRGARQPALATGCARPCSDPSVLEQGMNTLRQVELLDVTVRAFLQAVRHDDADARRFLESELAAENPT